MRNTMTVLVLVLAWAVSARAVDLWLDVDTAIAEAPVNLFPLTDDADFKSVEAAVAYNATGMALYWHFTTTAGAYSVTAVTPTTGGAYDWTDQGDAGIYTIEIPASGGASINNDTEGFGWFTGSATGVLPWRGPVIGFRAAAMNNVMIDGGALQGNLEDMYDGTGYAGGTAKLGVDAVAISGDTTAANTLELAYDGTKVSVADIYSDAGTVDDIPTPEEVAAAVMGSIIDGTIDLEEAIACLLAKEIGKATVTDNGTTRTIVFYLADGTTAKLALTAAEADGARATGAEIDPE